jgi:hypothetical protein
MANASAQVKKAPPKHTSSRKKHAPAKPAKQLPQLNRATFCTSREMDFFNQKELVTQTGHQIDEWPLVVVKELIDNGLDACDELKIAPVIDVVADRAGIAVRDNGPGLPERTLQGAMDFSVRSSNREAYVAPDRGAQGNALMTLLAMPRVIDPDGGRFIVVAGGKRHVITCGADPISQRAVVNDDVTDLPKCKNARSCKGAIKQALSPGGTEARIEWTPSPASTDHVLWPFDSSGPLSETSGLAERFFALVEGFALFNPHATIRLDWFGKLTTWDATNPTWEKWRPKDPTSSHWYGQRHIERLIGAYITLDRETNADRLASDFVAEFDGLSGSQKRAKVLADADLKRARLSDLVTGGKFNSKRIATLLAAMQAHTRPIQSARLGVIGEGHLRTRLLAMGIKPESFQYSVKSAKCKNWRSGQGDKASFIPWVLESAFGYLGEDGGSRRFYPGANWSAAIKNPFRSFGSTGEGLEALLADMRAGREEPVVFALHVSHPCIEYTDRGKSAMVIGGGQ